MNLILFDDKKVWQQLLPLTFTRPVSGIRIGILTITEKWEKHLKTKAGFITENYLSEKFSLTTDSKKDNLFVASNIVPDLKLVSKIKKLKPGSGIKRGNLLIAFNAGKSFFNKSEFLNKSEDYDAFLFTVAHVWDIFKKNGEAIELDFDLLTKGRKSQPLSKTNTVIGKRSRIFLEKGAKAEASVFNTTSGSVYLGKNSEVMEGSVVRGGFALCEESALKLSAKVYGPSTIGPHSKVGGEMNNSVIFGFSNKAHDGFLGNSVLGEWCNLGADTNNSNLKNNYGNIKLHSYLSGKAEDSGLQFCGLIMGDHSKSGINTMFNTGTVVGVGANIFGGGFPPTHIPSFSWGGSEGFETYRLDKLFETAERVFSRRHLELNQTERAILERVFKNTEKQRG